MASYVVMEPPRNADEDAILLRDGFAFLAFLAPFLWFLWHRMWIEAALAFAAALVFVALGTFSGWSTPAAIASFCVSIFVGLEARSLRAAMLARRGWTYGGVLDAAGRADAELRYAALRETTMREDTVSQGMIPALTPAASSHPQDPFDASRRSAEGGPALGLFSYPGSR